MTRGQCSCAKIISSKRSAERLRRPLSIFGASCDGITLGLYVGGDAGVMSGGGTLCRTTNWCLKRNRHLNTRNLSKNSNPKKTTDDCYTPPLVYDAIKKWACGKYGIDPDKIVRPFYPGGDYEHYDYPAGCTVLDNPPFSILAKICDYYLNKGIDFFLFAPSLTAFSGANVAMRMNHIICDADIVYENGAIVRTAFVTSYGGRIIAQTSPDLGKAIKEAVAETLKATKKELPKYRYPHEVLTAAALQKYAHYGVDFEVRRDECMLISKLDAQKDSKKSIYGGGLLLNDEATKRHAAAERAAAERAAAVVWQLSEREKQMAKSL